MSEISDQNVAGQRGPADHAIREQIILAAMDYFARYGYDKTTVSELAREVGFSKAYIYKFFDSKQAIGEAICGSCLSRIVAAAEEAISDRKSASDKLRSLFKSLISSSVEMFFADRKLYDLTAASTLEGWSSYLSYQVTMSEMLRTIILEGRASGEFERKTPIDETCRAILQAMQSFVNPVMLQHNLDLLPDAPDEVASLVLRSLAP
jgi:AcrR family transcriptional regulator